MEALIEIGEIKLNDNYDSYHVLQSLVDKGFEIRIIPTDDPCYKYGILAKMKIKTTKNYFDELTAVPLGDKNEM